MTREFRKL